MRIVLAFLLTGCVAMPNGSDHGSDDDNTPPPPTPVASGTYRVHSSIDLTVEALLPEPAEQVVLTLRDFSENPAATLIDLTPAQDIRGDLPSYVEGKLEGWINDEVAKLKVDGVPVTELAGTTAALAETALTQFALDSSLSIDGTTATHDLSTLDLTPTGFDVTFALEDLPEDLRSATATCSSTKTSLSIGDHGYALPYGEYVWRAVNQTMIAQHGVDLRGALGVAMNCPALAHTVATKCVLGVCVGHETQLTSICETGLDEVVDRMHAKLAELRIDALHLAAGNAMLVDADRDGIAERLDAGVWTAEINAGQGLRHVPATFTATR